MTEENSSSPSNGIEVAMLEKRLEALRDTQESVQGLSLWCQANKKHSTPIIDTWLRVLRRSPVEKRLTMFYLANDVVQHAKKKGDLTVVNQWAVATQKATPHVRSPSSVSTAIIRIFKIWEERGIYSKDTVADLIALVSKHNPVGKEIPPESKKKPEIYTASDDNVKEFQSSALAAVIKLAFKLKSHLGVTFRTKQYVNMNMEQLIASIKDRQHGMSVVENMSELLDACRVSENKLVHEVEERRKIVEAAEVAIIFYENVRAEALIVSNAYKSFTERVIKTKDNVDKMIRDFAEMEGSPIPSPDRLSPFDEVKVMLPSLAELEARQAQASSLILQGQSNSAQSMLPNSTSDGTNNMMYSASQWPNYAMQLQLMQQQMAQAYSAFQAEANAKAQGQQPQQTSEITAIPLPPESGIGNAMNSQQPPLPSPIPQPSTPNKDIAVPYDPESLHQYITPSQLQSGDEFSSVPTDYQGETYEEERFNYSYDEGAGEQEEPEDDYLEQQFNSSVTTTPPTPTSRYHPYANTTSRRARGRRLSESSPRPRFSSPAPSTPYRTPTPIPFNPRNPNTTPILRRGGPRFNSYSRGHGNVSSTNVPANTTSNLLRLAQYQVEPPVNDGIFGAPSKDYHHGLTESGDERLNGGEAGNSQEYSKSLLLNASSLSGRGTPRLAEPRGPRGLFKPQMRGRGLSPGFRTRAPRRGNYYIP